MNPNRNEQPIFDSPRHFVLPRAATRELRAQSIVPLVSPTVRDLLRPSLRPSSPQRLETFPASEHFPGEPLYEELNYDNVLSSERRSTEEPLAQEFSVHRPEVEFSEPRQSEGSVLSPTIPIAKSPKRSRFGSSMVMPFALSAEVRPLSPNLGPCMERVSSGVSHEGESMRSTSMQRSEVQGMNRGIGAKSHAAFQTAQKVAYRSQSFP